VPLARLQSALDTLLSDARLAATALPGTELNLWLLDPAHMTRPFDREETQRILNAPPYWCFCWASGLAMARWIAEHPEWVQGKRVLDVGAGSGVAAIAAARAGAAQVLVCDLDPLALLACQANAALNGVTLGYCADVLDAPPSFDLLLVADVLYDQENLPLLDAFLTKAPLALVADSRVRDFAHPRYERLARLEAHTLPDLAEPEAFRHVSLYLGRP
jgi:predicted nicotinamide N-methyase